MNGKKIDLSKYENHLGRKHQMLRQINESTYLYFEKEICII